VLTKNQILKELRDDIYKPFEDKLTESNKIIENAFKLLKPKELTVSFSGGKDSTAVLHLVRGVDRNVKVLFCNTGVEYPETMHFVKKLKDEWNLDIIETHYKKSFWQCADEYGFPGMRGLNKDKGGGSFCVYYLKGVPTRQAIRDNNWKGMFDGVTAAESRTRMFAAKNNGSFYFNKQWGIYRIRPILYWTEEEVWDYLKENNIPHNELYDKGKSRTGCLPCTAYKDWKIEMQKMNPKMYKIIQHKMGQSLLDDF